MCVAVGCGQDLSGRAVLTRADGVVAATVTNVSGLLDLAARRMVADPARHWAARASRPELLGLPAAAREATALGG